MSEDNFQWTDDLVKEYNRNVYSKQSKGIFLSESASINEFKQSKQQAVDKKDWEIVSMISINNEIIYFKDNRTVANDYPIEKFIGYPCNSVDDGTYKIHSVRYIVDNSIWSVKDNTQFGIISGFYINKDVDDYDNGQMMVYFETPRANRALYELQKAKQSDPNEEIKKAIKHYEENIPYFSYNDLKNLAYHDNIEAGTLHLLLSDLRKFIKEKLK